MPYDDDETLLRDLGDAVADSRAVTERARAAARAAFAWRTIDEELLELDHDSESAGLLVRGADTARVLGFRGREVTLEVEVDRGQLTGQVIPGQVCRVSVVTPAGDRWEVLSDESGVFMRPLEVSGPVRFVVECRRTHPGHRLGHALIRSDRPVRRRARARARASASTSSAACRALSPVRLIRAAMCPATTGVENDVPLQRASPAKCRTSPDVRWLRVT